MKPGDALDDVVGRVYEAALDPAAWQGAIEGAAALFGAERAMLFVADWSSGAHAPTVLAEHRMDPDVLRRWQSTYLPHDLWSHRMRHLPADFVTTGATVVEPRLLRRSPFYTDVLRKAGMEDALSASLARGDGFEIPLSFYAPQLFKPAHLRLLDRLARHLRLALRLQHQLSALHHRGQMLEEIVDRMSPGVVTLEANGRLVWANRRAQAVLDGRDGLVLDRGRLGCLRKDEASLLGAAVAVAAATDARVTSGQALSISRRSGRRPFAVLVVPLLPRTEPRAAVGVRPPRRAAVVVTIVDPEERPAVPHDRLRRTFGLTPAEARLAAAIATGHTLREYAGEAGITMNTARWTLKHVLDKTRCRRQSELVRLVLAGTTGGVG